MRFIWRNILKNLEKSGRIRRIASGLGSGFPGESFLEAGGSVRSFSEIRE